MLLSVNSKNLDTLKWNISEEKTNSQIRYYFGYAYGIMENLVISEKNILEIVFARYMSAVVNKQRSSREAV